MISSDLQGALAFLLGPTFVIVRVTQAVLRRRGASLKQQVLWPVALTPLVYEAAILGIQGHVDTLLPARLALEGLAAGLLALLFAQPGPTARKDRGLRNGAAWLTPPLIVFDAVCCDLRLYETVEEALDDIEPSEVEYEDSFGFDAQDRPLALFVNAAGQVGIEAAEGPPRPDVLEGALRLYLHDEKRAAEPDCGLPCLLTLAAERHTEKPIGRSLRQVLADMIAWIWTHSRNSAKPR